MARRYGLSGDDAADFSASVRLRLVEDDYAVIRKFRGASSLRTYLTMVISTFACDNQVQQDGRWRPSAEARRQGPLAVRLETLVYRKRYTVQEAAELLRTAGETQLTDRELAKLLHKLPPRMPLRPTPVDATQLTDAQSPDAADGELLARARQDARHHVLGILEQWIRALPVEDRAILQMHFWEGLNLAQIARALLVDQKQLYRRRERLLLLLREDFLQNGITAAMCDEFLDEPES